MCMRLILIFQLVRNEGLNFRLGSVTYFDSVYIMGSIKFLLEFMVRYQANDYAIGI
jgi:hypothetical protein